MTNLDWRAGRQRQATPGPKGGALAAIDRAQVIVLAGDAIEERAPVIWLRVRKAALRAGAVVVRANAPADALTAIAEGCKPRRAAVGRYRSGARARVRRRPRGLRRPFDLHCERTRQRARRRSDGHAARIRSGLCGREPRRPGRASDVRRRRRGELRRSRSSARIRCAMGRLASARASALAKIPFLVVSDLFMTETASSQRSCCRPRRAREERDDDRISPAICCRRSRARSARRRALRSRDARRPGRAARRRAAGRRRARRRGRSAMLHASPTGSPSATNASATQRRRTTRRRPPFFRAAGRGGTIPRSLRCATARPRPKPSERPHDRDAAVARRARQVGDSAARRRHDVRVRDARRAQSPRLDAAASRPESRRTVGA